MTGSVVLTGLVFAIGSVVLGLLLGLPLTTVALFYLLFGMLGAASVIASAARPLKRSA